MSGVHRSVLIDPEHQEFLEEHDTINLSAEVRNKIEELMRELGEEKNGKE